MAPAVLVAVAFGGCSRTSRAVDRFDANANDVPDVRDEDGGDLRGGDVTDVHASEVRDLRGDDVADVRASDVRDGREFDIGDGTCHLAVDAARPPFVCGATFDDDGWRVQPCFPVFNPAIAESVCDGYRSRSFDYGTHRWTCYWDPAGATLIAGDFVDDTNSFCDGGAYHLTLGDAPIPGTCTTHPVDLCADGGSPLDGSSQ